MRIVPGTTFATKAGARNGLTGVFSRTQLTEGQILITATEAKAVDNVTTYIGAGTAYMKYGQRLVDANGEYDKLIAISGNPANFNDYDIDRHAGTQDDPFPVSNVNELMALHDLI